MIAFPVKSLAPRERLDQALAALLRATQAQAAAVAAWRDELANLDRSVSGLSGSVIQYQTALAIAAARVDELGSTALRLATSLGD